MIEPASTRRDFQAILQLPIIDGRFPRPSSAVYAAAIRYLMSGLGFRDRTKSRAR